MRRVRNNIKHHRNWLGYFRHKFLGDKHTDFTFSNRNGMEIRVPGRLLPTYKECFFDETYFKGFPNGISAQQLRTVVDIGSNVGYFSLSVFSKQPQARVFAYEPMPNNFALLQQYQQENPNLDFTLVNKAVSDSQKTLVLNYDAKDSFTTAASVFSAADQPDRIEVQTTTLADIFADNKLTELDFLKLDCEGSEYEILYGAPATVLAKVKAIAVETHPGQGPRENSAALSTFLRENGFEISVLRSKTWAWRA